MWPVQAFATLGLAVPDGLGAAFETAAARVAGDLGARALAVSLWAFAVFDAEPPAALVTALNAKNYQGRDDRLLLQLAQVHAAEAANGRDSRIDDRLLARHRDHVAHHAHRTPKASRDVADACDAAGFARGLGAARPEGVDVLLETRDGDKIALVVDTPYHFTRNDGDPRPLGATKLRNRILTSDNFQVRSVPFFDWDHLKTDDAKVAFLRALLPDVPRRPPAEE